MSPIDLEPHVGPRSLCAPGMQPITATVHTLIAFVLLVVVHSADAQDPFLLSDPTFEDTNSSSTGIENAGHLEDFDDGAPRILPTEGSRRRETNESGLEGRFGHIAFPTFGRNGSITHLELLPYLRSGNQLLFSDLRLFMDNNGDFGGNAGLGLRHLDNRWDVVWGGNIFYDADQTTSELFHQFGFGLEAVGETFGGRANVYIPIGNTSMAFPQQVVNQRFVGNQLLFDVLTPIGEAMSGFDLEWEAAVPGDWAREHGMRLFLGGYFFQDSDVPDIAGGKFGVQATLFDHIVTHSELTHDDTFGTNATLGLTFYFPGGGLDKNWNTAENRLKDFVRRNYNVIVDRRKTFERDVVAMNAMTGNPLNIAHMSSAAAGAGTGDVDDPLPAMAGPMLAPDIIFVHADSVLTDAIMLTPGQLLLGEGADHMVSIADYGPIMLPTATTGTNLPTLLNVAGDAITMDEGSLVSGFVIQDPTGHGIVMDGLGSASVRNVDILGAGGDGLRITNMTGDVAIENILIEDAAGTGLYVDNLSGSLAAIGATTINDSAISGVMIENSSGTAVFEDLSITNTTAGLGVDLLNNTGQTTFELVDITTDGGTGLQALTAGTLFVNAGEITSHNAAVADLEDTELGVTLGSIMSDGGALGVRLVDTTGVFFLVGGTSLGSGGFITNKTTGILLENVESAFFNALDFDANGVGVQSTGSEAVGINGARFADTTGLAIDSLNDEFLQVSQSVFSDNGAAGVGTIRYRTDTVGDYSLLLSNNDIDDADSGNVVEILTEAGAAGSSLAMQVNENGIQHDADNSVGMRVDWNGAISGSMTSNEFGSSGDAATGLSINTPSTTDASILQLSSNTFFYSGNNIVATELTSDGPLTLTYQNNLGIFTGGNTTGIEATFNEVVTATISGNRIEHQGGGGTTVLVNDVMAGSSFSIENNLFLFPDNGAVVERGIIFNNVTGGTINLFGTLDNRILDGTQPFFAPAATTTGSILINGVNTP